MGHNGGQLPTSCLRAWHAIRQTHDLVSRQIDTALADCCGISSTELRALVCIQDHVNGVRLSSVCDGAGLSQPAVSRLVERLEARGLVVRSRDERDRRSVLLFLTAEGAELTQRAAAVHAETVRSALGPLLAGSDERRVVEIFQHPDDQ